MVAGPVHTVGRYTLFGEIASGGMASVHLGRMRGAAGFSKTVAIKRMHKHLTGDPDLAAALIDEARIAARINHPNVVTTLDAVDSSGSTSSKALDDTSELLIVLEYVHGEALSRLLGALWRKGTTAPIPFAVTIVSNALHGLHAAHEAKDERGEPLGIVHRDVSPQNILIGADGGVRVLDFGVAKAMGRSQHTREGVLKGKMAYMAPEQLRGIVDRRTDLYAAGIVLWEVLTGKRLFQAESQAKLMQRLLAGDFPVVPPSTFNREVPAELDAIVMRALARDPNARYATAREMALALERAFGVVPPSQLGAWVEELAGEELQRRSQLIAEIEAPAASKAAFASTLMLANAPPPPAKLSAPTPAEPVTQMATALTRRSSQSSSARGVVIGVAVVVMLAGIGVLGYAAGVVAETPPRADVGASVEPAASVAPMAELPELPPEEGGEAIVTPPTERTKAVTGEAKPVHSASPSEPRAKPDARKRKVDCTIPYDIDDQGHKIYKRECLK